MMLQREKLERFKSSQKPRDALHAKFCVCTGNSVHGDHDWGHLQIDAISVFLLVLSQVNFKTYPNVTKVASCIVYVIEIDGRSLSR